MQPQLFRQAASRQHFTRNFSLIGALLVLCYLFLFVFQARVDIQLETASPQSSFFRIYWAGPEQSFSEKRMAYAQVDARRSNYFLYIGSLGNIERIRIDPLEHAGKVRLNSLNISQFSYRPVELERAGDYEPYRPNQQIRFLPTSSGLQIETLGQDGHFEIDLKVQRTWEVPEQHILNIAGILIALVLLMRVLNPLLTELRFVPLLLIIAWGLALLMALSTGLNLHPDEVVHLAAVQYYAENLLPPALDLPGLASSYSIYGHSRLSDYEVFYQLAGYFQTIPALFNATPLFGARAFGLLIFALLILFSMSQRTFRPFALPLLLSAQTWYLFSYTNSDAFALALTLFVAYLACIPQSSLNRYLQETQPTAQGLKLLGFGLLFGAMLLLKVNYYFFILFLLLYLAWRLAHGDFPDRRILWKRLLLIGVVAVAVYGGRAALDIHANGWHSDETRAEMQEKFAAPAFKPSTSLEHKHPMLVLKDRGYSAGYVLDHARWFEKSFQSAFGVYGFSDHFASQTWYDLVRYLALALLGVLLIASLRKPETGNRWLLLGVALCSGGLVIASAWHSWTVAFQPQGRYLLPVLPMLGMLYYHVRGQARQGLLEWLSILLFLLAVYSFIYSGLGGMGILNL